MQTMTEYFLGGNTAQGFYSLYDSFCPPRGGMFLWVIKGGPGCGKSTFMKTIAAAAEEAGLVAERVRCSGDPHSLDAVCVPAWNVGYVDGTAPHVLDVPYPAAAGAYLDLGQFYDIAAVRAKLSLIVSLNSAYKSRYREAYALLRAEDAPEESEPWQQHAIGRFARAITCEGLCDLTPAKAERLPARELSARAEASVLLGRRLIDLRSPLHPARSEGFFLPDSGVCCRLDDAAAEERLAEVCERVCPILAQAKALHDELEALYNPHVDFAGVHALAQTHIARLKK